jgi:hypothetical protein
MIFSVGAKPYERSGEPFKSFFAVNVAKHMDFAWCREFPETLLKLFAIDVAKQGFVGCCVVRPGGDHFESFLQ